MLLENELEGCFCKSLRQNKSVIPTEHSTQRDMSVKLIIPLRRLNVSHNSDIS